MSTPARDRPRFKLPPLRSPDPPGVRWRRLRRLLLLWIVVLIAVNYWSASRALKPHERIKIPYSPTFLDEVKAGNVSQIASKGLTVQGDFKKAVRYPPGKKGHSSRGFKTEVPAFANDNQLSNLLESKGVVINAKSPTSSAPLWETVVFGFGPSLLLIGLLVYLMRRGGVTGALGMFGRSKARRYEGGEGAVSFKDVAGVEEAKRELTEVVDFLRHPERYAKLGARIPHGVLLYGPPGTGKTLLARAVAGEAGAPFFSVSASEFIEAIVGIGASRVRDLFKQARESPPAIVFIDELDAIGRSRSAGVNFGGSDEREQTLNQILTEMDGFDPTTGVIVIGATNRPDVLDQALLRPGRFDRRVAVQAPDRPGREAILRVHTRGMPLGDDVDLAALAATTVGMVGADLANLANEAALVAAGREHERVRMADFTDALEKIILGAERKLALTEADRERTAYHEAGHALVGMLTPGADPVRKVSIIPRGMALGVTLSAPADDRVNYSRGELIAKIKVMLGGRTAEEVVYGEMTTGAESDLQQLTMIARHMVGRFGMSDKIGPLTAIPADGQGPLLPGAAEVSERTQELVDEETRAIVEEAHEEVFRLLTENRSRLDALAQALLANETLDEAEAYQAAGVPAVPAPALS
jgi:cell division protease FtsH